MSLGKALEMIEVDHIYWGTQEPFYSKDVLPLLGTINRKAVK